MTHPDLYNLADEKWHLQLHSKNKTIPITFLTTTTNEKYSSETIGCNKFYEDKKSLKSDNLGGRKKKRNKPWTTQVAIYTSINKKGYLGTILKGLDKPV